MERSVSHLLTACRLTVSYTHLVGLIKKGLAYVCQLSPEEFRAHRGDIGVPATSPYRDRPVEESLDLFARMRAGEFPLSLIHI